MIGTGTLELGRHLRDDHVHRFRLAQAAFAHEALEPHRARGIHEDDAIEVVGHAALEEERNVADDEAVPANARLLDESRSHALDFRVHDGVELLELGLLAEDDAPQRATV